MSVTYYTFDVNGRHTGLVRRSENHIAQTLTLEHADNGQWVDEPNLIRHFHEPDDLVQIDRAEADRLAAEYGVSL